MRKALELIYRARLLKFILFFLFLVNTGLVEGLLSLPISGQSTDKERIKKQTILIDFVQERIEQAEAFVGQGGVYSSRNYFGDLKRIFDKEKELAISTSVYNESQKLWALLLRSLKNGDAQGDNLEKYRDEYREYIDPGHKPREKFKKQVRRLGLFGVLTWFFILYLKSLPLALILYLIWLNDDWKKEQGKFCFRSPVSFILALIIYPAVIGYLMWQWCSYERRGVWAEAELRRTKNKLFTILSEDEVSQIRQFAQSGLSIGQWQKYLRHQGLIYRHSLIVALLATLIVTLAFAFIPRPSEAKPSKQRQAIALKQYIAQELGGNLARMSIRGDRAKGEQNDYGDCQDLVYEFCQFWFSPLVRAFKAVVSFFKLKEIYRKIDHVPIAVVQVVVVLSTDSN